MPRKNKHEPGQDQQTVTDAEQNAFCHPENPTPDELTKAFSARLKIAPFQPHIKIAFWKSWRWHHAQKLNPEQLFRLAELPRARKKDLTPAHIAILSGRPELLPQIPTEACPPDTNGDTLLHYAARFADPVALQTLIAFGHPLNIPNRLHETPLQTAVEVGSARTIRILLHAGAKIQSIHPYRVGPLQTALLNTNRPAFDLLVKHGADLTETHPLTLRNFLHLAALYNVFRMIKPLIAEYGLPPDETDHHGATAVHLAAGLGHLEALNELQAAGANLHTPNHGGFTALDQALAGGQTTTFNRLLSLGVTGGKDSLGKTIFAYLPDPLPAGVEGMLFEMLHPKYWEGRALEFAGWWHGWEPTASGHQKLKLELSNRAKHTLFSLRDEQAAAKALTAEYRNARKQK